MNDDLGNDRTAEGPIDPLAEPMASSPVVDMPEVDPTPEPSFDAPVTDPTQDRRFDAPVTDPTLERSLDPQAADPPMPPDATPEVSEPVLPWAAPAPPWRYSAVDPPTEPATVPPGPPTPPGMSPPPPNGPRPSGWRQFVVGALVGALVGGGTAAGVAVATRDDSRSTRTVVVGAANRPVRNTSVINQADDVQSVLEKVDGAVVAIQTGAAADQGLFTEGSVPRTGGEGTGFVISADGLVVTNDHVVEGANGRIEVAFGDGTKQAAELLGRAPEYDLAVLKIDAKNLPTVKLGSSDALQVGDEVVAVGNALGLQGGLTVTQGIVSGKGRVVPEQQTGQTLYDMLQTDAAINPGNSGGPLVNAAGEVVGINTALAGGSQNVGFAISIDSAKSVIQQLRDGGTVRVAFLGVSSSEVTPGKIRSLGLKTKTGAVIEEVSNNTAAKDAGIEVDDVIVAIGDRTITSPQDVGAEVRRFKPGETVDVTVERGGTTQVLPVKLGARPDSVG